MWSKELINTSRKLLNISGVSVKSLDGNFGVLQIGDIEPKYMICFYDENKTVSFKSIDEIINAGWAVD